MKKTLLIITSGIMIASGLKSQTLPNSDFEDWTYEAIDVMTGADFAQNYIKSTDKKEGAYAIKLETSADDDGGGLGVFLYGQAGENGIEGGVPYTSKPDSIVGYAKYNIQSGDSAILLVQFYGGGQEMPNMFFFTGNQNSFVRFAFPLYKTPTVDSMALAGVSSNFMGAIKAGSWIIFDDIQFIGNGATQLPNTNFENWTIDGYDNPDIWYTQNSNAYKEGRDITAEKTTDAHNGTYALKLTADIYDGYDNDGKYYVNSNGEIRNFYYDKADNYQAKGGSPFTNQIDTLTGWYKLTEAGTDTAAIYLNFLKNSTVMNGSVAFDLFATNTYTYFEIPVSLESDPDSIRISIRAHNYPPKLENDGSILYIDHLKFKSEIITGISTFESLKSVSAFPNPFKDQISINFSSNVSQTISLDIYSIEGKLLKSNSINASNGNNQISINSSELSSGIYNYVIKGNDAIISRGQLIK